ncbi:uncharacterized protein BDR25DRAFT_345633 [Lindgomyces ingoldianus]|uniref:Uncharacterized protein n=1 Tax=Lindgomyces ingoldianus TaxID=673940 RepID=A0ACB6QHG8_9PLEO|nr:uncharacterized protein BDR25DRAFT_345633 [Lindgomyces ingoldianus]KAF2466438.1 hypothetical protein BDR25DRAFT_345633 [Lindgomyces ingoldianus]
MWFQDYENYGVKMRRWIGRMAALSIQGIYADFVVITNLPPRPTTTFKNDADMSKWSSDYESAIAAALISYASEKGTSWIEALSSAESEIDGFARTATYTDIPDAVTNDVLPTIFTTVPDWYTELPKQAKEFPDQFASDIVSIRKALETGIATGGALMRTVGVGLGMAAAAAAGAVLL